MKRGVEYRVDSVVNSRTLVGATTLCLKKNIPDVFSYNSRKQSIDGFL